MNFLNSGEGYELFAAECQKRSYIDKSMMVQEVYQYSKDVSPFICVTRPRRFGKSTAANMIAAFFDPNTKAAGRELFRTLQLGRLLDEPDRGCWSLQGEHHVIRINMIDMITEKTECYHDFMETVWRLFAEDIAEQYPDLKVDNRMSIPEMLKKTKDHFIFVIDEWDVVFECSFMREEDKERYIEFLKALLKDKSYVWFVYMTGILPIAKYSSGSPLNMFHEFSAFQDEVFFPYFGITKVEVEELISLRHYQKPSIEELSFWYDGYIRNTDQEHIFNPHSVSRALASGVCRSYWTGTGPMNEIRDMIQHNVKDIREDIIRMAGGEVLKIELSGFSAEKNTIGTKDEILSAMVVYGFLSYHDGSLAIPNHELVMKFREALAAESLGLKQSLDDSKALLEATLNRENEEIARRMEILHDEKIPFFQYNDENSLACVVMMGYYAALDRYRIQRENKAGKGYVDFSFTPLSRSETPIILELKYNHSAQNALKCIHEREYLSLFREYRQVLLVGINYSEKTKKHTCLTELIQPEHG